MAGNDKKGLDRRTIEACGIIVDLLTAEEQELLDIVLAGKKIPVFDQLLARGFDQIPIDDSSFVFRAKAAQILATNKRGIALLAKLRQEDFLLQLLDPESYKEKQSKGTFGKTKDKRDIDMTNDNVNLIKSLGRNIAGEGGTNRDTDYGSMWDKTDRARLDAVQIKRNVLSGETGKEDDSRGTDEEEGVSPVKNMKSISDIQTFIEKVDELDYARPKRRLSRPSITLSDNYQEIEEKKIDIFDMRLSHNTNSAVSDTAINQNTFVRSKKEQGFLTLRDRVILADAINSLHNVEFPDTREKFFKLFDPLFRRTQSLCQ